MQRGGYHGRYLPSGHLVYMHEGTLFAAPFDLDRLELTGQPVPVLEGVTPIRERGARSSPSRTADARVPAGTSIGAGRADPVDGPGGEDSSRLRAVAGHYSNIRFSPDGQRLAMDIREGKEQDVWVYEWGRDTLSRLTFDPGEDTTPVWTPDGRRIAFASDAGGQGDGEPLLAAGRWDGRGGAPDREQEPAVPDIVASEREVPGLHASTTRRRAGTS